MNRITRVVIKNFKSLLDVNIDFPAASPVLYLVGLNGSGKSTVLQAFDFIGEVMRGGVNKWLKDRGWSPSDLTTKIHSSRKKSLIEVELSGVIAEKNFTWSFSYNPSSAYLRCTTEALYINNESILTVREGKLTLDGVENPIAFSYEGSILSQLSGKSLERHPLLKPLKDFLASIYSFDLLSPRNMRGKSRKSGTIGRSGESLAGYVSNLPPEAVRLIDNLLRMFYPWISSSEIKSFRSGWKELRIREHIGQYPDPTTGEKESWLISRSSQHANDGTLRILAIIASLLSPSSLILFDEIENGFNPHAIKNLVDILHHQARQVIVTTHSPEILQYLPEEYVDDSVKFVFRTPDGTSSVENFFTLPAVKKRRTMLMPGEAYLDMDLEALARTLSEKNAPPAEG